MFTKLTRLDLILFIHHFHKMFHVNFLQNAMCGKLEAAHDWLEDPTSVVGGVGEKSLRYILEYAERVADRCLPPDNNTIQKMCGDIRAMTNALCELRQEGKVRVL